MNTGAGDAVDLGWKLEAVLKGWGGDSLLDSTAKSGAPWRSGMRELRPTISDSGFRQRPAETLMEDGPEGDRVRAELGKDLPRMLFVSNGILGHSARLSL